MSDPRLTPDATLQDQRVNARVVVPVADLVRRPDGPRDRQLLFGAAVVLHSAESDWRYVQAAADGYCGFVAAQTLGRDHPTTHRVAVAATHVYARPDIKSPDLMTLSHGSLLRVQDSVAAFARIAEGFVPARHIRPVDRPEDDPAAVAALYLGTPYLWGGNSRSGIDCSGLVQAAFGACGIPCPGDSDMQAAELGTALPEGTPYLRNDLLFWRGHVALLWDTQTIIHANGHTMSTAFEPVAEAIRRIAQSDGAVTAHRRVRSGRS